MRHFACVRKMLSFFRRGYFELDGQKYPLFQHDFNCGRLPERMTERAVELALLDRWLSGQSDVIEIGAVTPYYWPGRVGEVADPADQHPLVGLKKSVFDICMKGRTVASISTFEHIGLQEFGLSDTGLSGVSAMIKVLQEARSAFITIPIGYNKEFDQALFSEQRLLEKSSFMMRGPGPFDNNWEQVDAVRCKGAQYGPHWANCLAIIEW